MAFRRISKDSLSISKYYKMNAPATPHEKVVVWKVGERIEGRFVDRRVNGEFVSFILQLESGELISIPKTAAIESGLANVAKGSLIALTNEGKKKLKGGKSFNQILIELDEAAPEESSDSDDDDEDAM